MYIVLSLMLLKFFLGLARCISLSLILKLVVVVKKVVTNFMFIKLCNIDTHLNT